MRLNREPLDGAGYGIEQCGNQWRITYQPHSWTKPLPIGGKFAKYYDSEEEARQEADKANAARRL